MPHDNALIAAGCKRYGYDAAVVQIAHGIFHAANLIQGYRLPELMSGHQRKVLECSPKSTWASILPGVGVRKRAPAVTGILGLRADAPQERLYLAPALPPWLTSVEVEHLQVGRARASFRCWREGKVSRFEIRHVEGPLTVVPPARLSRTGDLNGTPVEATL